jgi:hypothetical protein
MKFSIVLSFLWKIAVSIYTNTHSIGVFHFPAAYPVASYRSAISLVRRQLLHQFPCLTPGFRRYFTVRSTNSTTFQAKRFQILQIFIYIENYRQLVVVAQHLDDPEICSYLQPLYLGSFQNRDLNPN